MWKPGPDDLLGLVPVFEANSPANHKKKRINLFFFLPGEEPVESGDLNS